MVRVLRTRPALRCACCHGDGPRLRCAGCGTATHADCRRLLARCPTLGCPLPAPSGRGNAACGLAFVGAVVLLLVGVWASTVTDGDTICSIAPFQDDGPRFEAPPAPTSAQRLQLALGQQLAGCARAHVARWAASPSPALRAAALEAAERAEAVLSPVRPFGGGLEPCEEVRAALRALETDLWAEAVRAAPFAPGPSTIPPAVAERLLRELRAAAEVDVRAALLARLGPELGRARTAALLGRPERVALAEPGRAADAACTLEYDRPSGRLRLTFDRADRLVGAAVTTP